MGRQLNTKWARRVIVEIALFVLGKVNTRSDLLLTSPIVLVELAVGIGQISGRPLITYVEPSGLRVLVD